MDRIVSVGSTVTKSFEADELSIGIAIDGRRNTRNECTSSYNALLGQIRAAFISAGVSPELVRNSNFSVHPHSESLYEKDEDGTYYKASQRLEGYDFNADIDAKIEVASQLASPIWVALSSCGKEVSFCFTYGLANPDEAKRQLLVEAIELSREEASILAKASGATLGSVISISHNYDDEFPGRMLGGFAEAPRSTQGDAPRFVPEPIEVECEVNVQWELVI